MQFKINKKCSSPFVISKHRLNASHDFDWNNVWNINFRREAFLQKTNIRSALLKRQERGLNLQENTEFLPNKHLFVLRLFPNSNRHFSALFSFSSRLFQSFPSHIFFPLYCSRTIARLNFR